MTRKHVDTITAVVDNELKTDGLQDSIRRNSDILIVGDDKSGRTTLLRALMKEAIDILDYRCVFICETNESVGASGNIVAISTEDVTVSVETAVSWHPNYVFIDAPVAEKDLDAIAKLIRSGNNCVVVMSTTVYEHLKTNEERVEGYFDLVIMAKNDDNKISYTVHV